MLDIITIGEILAEVLTEKVDQAFTSPGTLLGPFPSGAPAICIDQAARMGAKAAIIAKVGQDDFGKLNLTRLAGDGVDVSHVIQTPDNTTGTAFVTYFSDGERKFIFHFSHAACGSFARRTWTKRPSKAPGISTSWVAPSPAAPPWGKPLCRRCAWPRKTA